MPNWKSWLAVGLGSLLGLVSLTGAAPDTAKTYWTSSAGGYLYRWTSADLAAMDAATRHTAYSVESDLKHAFGKPDADEGYSFYQVSFIPQSVVGALLSYERDDYWEGGAHPSGGEAFVVVDVRHPERAVNLTDLFPAAQIRHALLSDSIVQHVLTREKIVPPETLEGLIKALALKNFGGDDDDKYTFPETLLQDFAFHHVENGKVAVRFLMPHGGEIYRFQHTQLGILLPIPARLKLALDQAASGQHGALMQNLKPIQGNHVSTLILSERKEPRAK